MTRWEWVIKVLSESAKEELPGVYKKWLFENVVSRNIRINVEDCVCNELEWTDKYRLKGLLFIQDGEIHLSRMCIYASKPALVLVTFCYDGVKPCEFVYWYNPNLKVCENTSKAEKVAYKIRHFNLPTFEEWNKKNNDIELILGAYRVEIRPYCWGNGYTEYAFAMALSNCNALNVYTDRLFSSWFKHEYEAGEKGLEQWYDSTVATFYDFWERYINVMYLEPDV